MALAAGRAAAIAAFKAGWSNANTTDQTAAAMVDAMIALIQSGAVVIGPTGVATIISSSPGLPCTGTASGTIA